ncbi:hypothetical protein Q7A53_05320 [Halobacillus rhizosphaerae]|uniref:hypothetical protein n=1 Tax=Halobacillus rhizosphaerae TaxID=3064889 RepID=UPI00398B9BF9
MKTIYRGFEIEVKREECLGGWDMIFYTVTEIETDWEMLSGHYDSEDTEEDVMNGFKNSVDDYYENPEEYE